MKISGYTWREIAAAISEEEGGQPLTRQRISAIALAEKWSAIMLGRMAIYHESDVESYLAARRRTRLLIKGGWQKDANRLYRDDDIDSECPICGAFAITRPAWQANSTDEWLADTWAWRCQQGHTNVSSSALPA